METFYVPRDEFWNWFNRDTANDELIMMESSRAISMKSRFKPNKTPFNKDNLFDEYEQHSTKRMRTTRHIAETEAAVRSDVRYVVMFGRHRPGKKSKVWEGDGYLSLVGQMAHLHDLRGKMLEEPTYLDDIDFKTIEDLGELRIGNTEVQVVEVDDK